MSYYYYFPVVCNMGKTVKWILLKLAVYFLTWAIFSKTIVFCFWYFWVLTFESLIIWKEIHRLLRRFQLKPKTLKWHKKRNNFNAKAMNTKTFFIEIQKLLVHQLKKINSQFLTCPKRSLVCFVKTWAVHISTVIASFTQIYQTVLPILQKTFFPMNFHY